MPIYTYVCKDCGGKFDLLIGVTSEKVELKCKKCNSKNIEKTFGPFSVGNPTNKSAPSIPCGPSMPSGPGCPMGTCSGCPQGM